MINQKHVLIIAFSFYPDKSVAALRPKYWAESLIKKGFSVTVFTQAQLDPLDKGIQKEIKVQHIPLEPKKGFSLIADPGIRWKSPILNELNKYDRDAFSSIIITGGPFMHMLIGSDLKTKFNTQLILDFRDPFAINPRFNDSWFKKLIKKQIEKKICAPADHIITVNKLTSKLIQCDSNRISILDNGFDESLVNQIKSGNREKKETTEFRIIHTGKFYYPLIPSAIIEAVEERVDFKFIHYGDNLELEPSTKNVSVNPYVLYSEVLSAIHSCNAGLVLTNGESFVSTTKIFDYIGLEKQILIVTNGEKKTGNLHEITKDNPNVFWSSNDKLEIGKTLDTMVQTPYMPFETTPYSRGSQFKKLLRILSKAS